MAASNAALVNLASWYLGARRIPIPTHPLLSDQNVAAKSIYECAWQGLEACVEIRSPKQKLSDPFARKWLRAPELNQ